ncbi:hypothetical protein [uncultured Draconibacterium sp.]|uniref:hypothetical protein n=1 Tax=uncultured Draconibacterium sp. TaxID=1573823 RepID=UPI0029C964B3|nr:hypothetical protein [uncultured Draconibacterium sp.]
MKYSIPILFIFFNREETALNSFQRIKSIKPSQLFLACDGPRNDVEGEKEIVARLRKKIVDEIDWECDVKKLFQSSNLGCSQGVYSAINWMFTCVDKGIILEDDCIPQSSFFSYMEELVIRYEKDERIGMIAGYNRLGRINITDSYCFSKYKACWGWATWKRSWKNMDLMLEWRNSKYLKDVLHNMGYKSADISDWKYKLKLIDNRKVSAWDWQWYFSLACQNQLTIFPKTSLITNNGFDSRSTHTFKEPKHAKAKAEISFPLQHPKYVLPSSKFDHKFYKVRNTFFRKLRNHLPLSVTRTIKKILYRKL